MTKTRLLLVASLLILAGFALLVWGLRGSDLLWQLGLAVVALAMLLSLSTQWAGRTAEPGEAEKSPASGDTRRPENGDPVDVEEARP